MWQNRSKFKISFSLKITKWAKSFPYWLSLLDSVEMPHQHDWTKKQKSPHKIIFDFGKSFCVHIKSSFKTIFLYFSIKKNNRILFIWNFYICIYYTTMGTLSLWSDNAKNSNIFCTAAIPWSIQSGNPEPS